MTTHHDTDPTPPHGTPRPTKFRTMTRLAAALEAQITDLDTQIADLKARRADAEADLADLNQLMIDHSPEPRD